MSESSKENLQYRIMAAGLNVLVEQADSRSIQLIKSFLQTSWQEVYAVWPYLSPQVRFRFFEEHIETFVQFLEEQAQKEVP